MYASVFILNHILVPNQKDCISFNLISAAVNYPVCFISTDHRIRWLTGYVDTFWCSEPHLFLQTFLIHMQNREWFTISILTQLKLLMQIASCSTPLSFLFRSAFNRTNFLPVLFPTFLKLFPTYWQHELVLFGLPVSQVDILLVVNTSLFSWKNTWMACYFFLQWSYSLITLLSFAYTVKQLIML